MSVASVEISGVVGVGSMGVQIHGPCLRQESLTISGSTAPLASAVTALEQTAANGSLVARIATNDAGCFVAIGTTPDPTATALSGTTRARRWIGAGLEISLPIGVGESVAVHS